MKYYNIGNPTIMTCYMSFMTLGALSFTNSSLLGSSINTVPIDRILSVKNARAWVSMEFT